MSTQDSVARRAWRAFEPIHAVVYFATETREQYAAAGLRGGWMGYFASRSAAMGAVGPEVVTAVFHNFSPALVGRAIPDAWAMSSPQRVLEARMGVADLGLRRLWGDAVESPEVREAAPLALEVAAGLRVDGRPLYAGHAGLPVPEVPHLALWHACTLLREHRFDGHIAALTGYGVDGLESLLLAVGTGRTIGATALLERRGWSDDEWTSAGNRLRERGLLDADGLLTGAGAQLHEAVERVTDSIAAPPWERMDVGRRARLLELLVPLATRLSGPGGLPYPNPIGVDRPVAG